MLMMDSNLQQLFTQPCGEHDPSDCLFGIGSVPSSKTSEGSNSFEK
jgi:hypothetical protein